MKFQPRSTPPWRLLFFGTDEFSLKTLQSLCANMVESRGSSGGGVISELHLAHPELKKPTSVEKYAAMYGLKQLTWPFDVSLVHKRYDVAVLASFGHLIPRKIVEAFPYGILNVHPSLLPQWRGAAPLHHTLLSGTNHTGVSIMRIMPKRFDHGPLLAQKAIDLSHSPIFSTLRDQLGHEGGKMIIDILRDLPEGLKGEKEQSSEGVSYAHKITQQNTWIDWNNQTVKQLDRQYRALYETTELRSEWEGTTVRLLDMKVPNFQPAVVLDDESKPGLPVFDKSNNVIWVKCKDGWAAFGSIGIRKKMDAKSFYNGYLTKKHLKGVCFTSEQNNLFDDSYLERISYPRPS